MTDTTALRPKKTRQRDAQKEATRGRIRDAARRLFDERGLETTTMEQIAEAGGLQRSTVYRYYRDKGEILEDIVADYGPRVRACMETLPALPTSERAIQRWMEDVTAMCARERLSLAVITDMAHRGKSSAAMEYVTTEILAGLGANSMAFRKAALPSAPLSLRAQAVFLIQQLTFSCELYLNDEDPKWCKAVRATAAANFLALMTGNAD